MPWSPFWTQKYRFRLHTACKKGDVELTCKHLYNGANPNARNSDGFLPIELLPCGENGDVLLDILFPYTFDDGCSVSFHTMTVAMLQNSSFFPRLMEGATEVPYDDDHLIFFRNEFRHVVKKHFLIFLDKFEHVVRAAIDEVFLYWGIIRPAAWDGASEYAEVLSALLARGCAEELVCTKSHLPSPPRGVGIPDRHWVLEPESTENAILHLIKLFNSTFDEDEITKMILQMVSYGLRVSLHDLSFVYHKYGHNELFRILLHMDVNDNANVKDVLSVMVFLQFYPRLDFQNEEFKNCLEMHGGSPHCDSPVDTYWADGMMRRRLQMFSPAWFSPYFSTNSLNSDANSLDTLFDYYNQEELKEFCLSVCRRKYFIEKVKRLPRVPSLVELSRNVAREFIMDEFRVSSASEFLTAVNALDIGEKTKSVLTLERKIY